MVAHLTQVRLVWNHYKGKGEIVKTNLRKNNIRIEPSREV